MKLGVLRPPEGRPTVVIPSMEFCPRCDENVYGLQSVRIHDGKTADVYDGHQGRFSI